jgi:signal transduction histidine kinase
MGLAAMDLTKLRTLDAALVESIIDEAMPPFVVCDAEGRVVMKSPSFATALGEGEAQAVEAAERLVQPARSGNGNGNGNSNGNGNGSAHGHGHELTVSQNRAAATHGTVFTARDGRSFRLQAASLGQKRAKKRSHLISFIDVTPHAQRAREATEQTRRWSDLVEIASDWRWAADAEGRITELSERFALYSGRPASLARGRKLATIGRLLHPQVTEFTELPAVIARRAFGNVVLLVTAADGRASYHRLAGMPVFSDETGHFLGYRGLATDISEQHEAEAALIASRNELQQAMSALRLKNAELIQALDEAAASGRARSEFLANVSHELRTPLNAIIGFAEVMREQIFGPVGNPKYQDYVNDIHMSASHLHALISDILDYSTVDAGRREIHFEPCDLSEEIAYCVRLLNAAAEKKRIRIEISGAAQPCIVEADRRSLRQIFTNLLSNAVKFTRELGSVVIKLTHTGKDVVVEIVDNGVGIAEDDLDRVTRPFIRGANEYARRQDGTGLGLALTKSLIELHQGTLFIDSRLGQGTTVSIRLPRRPDVA